MIWGWNQLVRATMNKPQLEEQFFECLYNMCYCRLKYGQIKQNKKALTSSLNEIKKFSARSPEMGGLRDEFDKLTKQIQASLK